MKCQLLNKYLNLVPQRSCRTHEVSFGLVFRRTSRRGRNQFGCEIPSVSGRRSISWLMRKTNPCNNLWAGQALLLVFLTGASTLYWSMLQGVFTELEPRLVNLWWLWCWNWVTQPLSQVMVIVNYSQISLLAIQRTWKAREERERGKHEKQRKERKERDQRWKMYW